MSDFDQILELLNNPSTGAEDLTLEGLTFDQISDVLAQAGIDVSLLSELSDSEITSLLSVEDSTSIELPGGTRIVDNDTTELGVSVPAALLAALIAAARRGSKGELSEEATRKTAE